MTKSALSKYFASIASVGGKRRKANQSKERLTEIGKMGAAAKWKNEERCLVRVKNIRCKERGVHERCRF